MPLRASHYKSFKGNNMSYIDDYEKALKYNKFKYDPIDALLREMHKDQPNENSHRYSNEQLSVVRAAAADRLYELDREDEARLLHDPKNHVIIKKHPKTKELTVHPAKWDLSEFNSNLTNFRHFLSSYIPYGPILSQTLEFSHLPGVDVLHARNPSIDGRTSDDRRFLTQYKHIINHASDSELRDMGVSRDISDEEILPSKLPDNHIRFYHYNTTEYEDYPHLPEYADVHIHNVPTYVHNFINHDPFLNVTADDDGFPIDQLEHHLENIRNSPVERSLTKKEKQG